MVSLKFYCSCFLLLLLQVMSKASIVFAATEVNPSNPQSINIILDSKLAQKLAPRGRFVVWFVADNAEIISDTVEFNVVGAFAYTVRLILLSMFDACSCFYQFT